VRYCVSQFTDEEDEMQQIRGLGTDIAVVGFSLLMFPICKTVSWFSYHSGVGK